MNLLLYKTARTDAALLDEVVGAYSWQNEFKEIGGKMYCGIGLKSTDGWIWEWDCGSESNREAEKGQASDAFKRAGFKWGIGAELYSAPKIFISKEHCNIKEYNGRYRCYDSFTIEKIVYDENENIRGLAIWNETKNERCFTWAK